MFWLQQEVVSSIPGTLRPIRLTLSPLQTPALIIGFTITHMRRLGAFCDSDAPEWRRNVGRMIFIQSWSRPSGAQLRDYGSGTGVKPSDIRWNNGCGELEEFSVWVVWGLLEATPTSSHVGSYQHLFAKTKMIQFKKKKSVWPMLSVGFQGGGENTPLS